MPRRGVTIPESELGELSKENGRWFDVYYSHPNAPKDKNYKNKVRKFLCFKKHNTKSFENFKLNDIEEFKKMLKDLNYENGINQYLSAISGFAEILRNDFPDKFPRSFLINVASLQEKRASKPSGEVLSLTQISYIKKFNDEEADKYEKFVFEKLFNQGVQLEELQEVGNKELEGNINYISKANQYFINITEYLSKQKVYPESKNINSDHFKKTHQANFLLCPNCQKKTENIAENWVLVRTEFDKQYRLVCINCKGEKK